GAGRPDRGGLDRRRQLVARVPGRDLSDHQADPARSHKPVDHLGLRRVHSAVPPDRAGEAARRQLPDGDLPLRRGLLEDRLRTRRGDLDRDARHRRDPERVRRTQDGEARRGDVKRARLLRRAGWNVLGLAVAVVLIFPVYWMVTTAFKPDAGIIAAKPDWLTVHPTTAPFSAAMAEPYFC